tara:strand:- start:148 stop:567 length:420 start_codon:yes stop_codon:yes gene_type:complete
MKIRETFRVIVLHMALTDKKQQALRLLSSGHSIPKAAAEIGVGRATLWKWTKEPEFSAELTVYRNKEAAGAQMALSHAVYEAVEVLRHIMGDEDSTNKEKTEAAKIVLDRSKLQLTDAKVKVKGGADALEKWLGSDDES